MDAHEPEDDTEEFLTQFELPSSSINLDWDTLLTPDKGTSTSDEDSSEESSSPRLKHVCVQYCNASQSDSTDNRRDPEYIPDKALLKELEFSSSEDDDLQWDNYHSMATVEEPPSEPKYTANSQQKAVNPVSIPPSERLRNQAAPFKSLFTYTGSGGKSELVTTSVGRSFSVASMREYPYSKASSFLLRRPSSEPHRKACTHPPADFVVSPSCPYFGLVPSHVEAELERRQERLARREPRIDRAFMDELHKLWAERRETRQVAEKIVHKVVQKATLYLEAALQGVVQPDRVTEEVKTANPGMDDEETKCPSKDKTQQAGSDSLDFIDDGNTSTVEASTVSASKVAAMRLLLEQQVDKKPILGGPFPNKRYDKVSTSMATEQTAQKKGTKTVSPGIMKFIDQLPGEKKETTKQGDVSPSKDGTTEKERASSVLCKRMAKKAFSEAMVQHGGPDDKRNQQIPAEKSVADIRKQLEAKMAEENGRISSSGGTKLSAAREREQSAGDLVESSRDKQIHLDKNILHGALMACELTTKDDGGSSEILSSKTCSAVLESSSKMTPNISRSAPDTRSVAVEDLAESQSAPSDVAEGASVSMAVLRLEQDTDEKKTEEIVIPRRQSSKTAEIFLKLASSDDSDKEAVKKTLDVPTPPPGFVRDTVENIEKRRSEQEKEEETTVQTSADPINDFCVNTAVQPHMGSILQDNLLYRFVYKIISWGEKLVAFVHNHIF